MTEPTNSDVLDAVTLELSRFTQEVVAEMHRLRDELAVERQRSDRLESTVTSLTASLRKFDTQAANIVDHITKLSADVDRRLDDVQQRVNGQPMMASAASVSDGNAAPVDDIIHFAPLTLHLDPVEPESPRDTSIDDLVARVVGAIDAPTDSDVGQYDRVEAGSAR